MGILFLFLFLFLLLLPILVLQSGIRSTKCEPLQALVILQGLRCFLGPDRPAW